MSMSWCGDMFSSWVEAWPVTKATAVVTAKKLICEVVCRFGLPETVESDRGTHFTGQGCAEILKGLHMNQRLHTPYYPQASGKAEIANGVL